MFNDCLSNGTGLQPVTMVDMAEDRIENGFHVTYLADGDGVRWLTINPVEGDMKGWAVDVKPDPDWYEQRSADLVPPDYGRTVTDRFVLESLWGVGERWCVPVDWGERVVRWIPPTP